MRSRVIGGLLCTLFMSFVACGGSRESRLDRPPAVSLGPQPDTKKCEVVGSLEGLQKLAPFTVLVPASSIANRDNVQALSWCPENQLAREDFVTGISVIQLPTSLKDPEAAFESETRSDANKDLQTDSVGTIRGYPALLTDPAKDPSGETPGGIKWVEQGILRLVGGNAKFSISDDEAVAESMEPVATSTPSR